jgi:hypothetical protein
MSSDREPPPPVPPPEMPRAELERLVGEGAVNEVERALREQAVRMPAVLEELDRVLSLGLGNLATAMATMLIDRFHVARADVLAERVLVHANAAGADELADLGAALIRQERLRAAGLAVDAALGRDPRHDRALYLSGRLAARRGLADVAFERIARVDPKLLGGAGLAAQARYAAFAGKTKAIEGALKVASKIAGEDEQPELSHVRSIVDRLEITGVDPRAMSLRTAMAIEYGSLLVELAQDLDDGGRFGLDAIRLGDVRRTIDRTIAAIRWLGTPIEEVFYANEDGEIVAAAIRDRNGVPAREWRHDRAVSGGSWLAMASAATHPHQRRDDVDALQRALDEGKLRTLALILPVGSRAPLVPDVVGRLAMDDELPWALDDEVDDTLELLFDEEADAAGDARDDADLLEAHVERFGGVLRAAQPEPRRGHVPFLDETPVPRG